MEVISQWLQFLDQWLEDEHRVRIFYSVSIFIALIAAASVPIAYAVYSKGEWKHHAYGRHLMASDSALTIILTLYFIASLIPTILLRLVVISALMIVFAALRVQRLRYMRRSILKAGYVQKDSVYGQRARERTEETSNENADDLRA